MIKYNIINEEFQFDFNIEDVIKMITEEIVKEESLESDHVVSFIIVSSEEIHEINKNYRSIDRPTDVISFAYGDTEKTLPYEIGDIYICYERVFSQAKDYGHSPLREFSFLVTHGMLHLLGYDHMVKEDEVVMFTKQDTILKNLGINR